jgi:CHASE2 domain-containing sensor protein/serine phosphatase RsbU (regulator of sigma subunit)
MTASKSNSDRARRILGRAIVFGAIVAVLVSLLTGEASRRWLFDRWQNVAPREIGSDKVAVVLVDSLSLEAVGPWPWPRLRLAELTDAIAAQDPVAIGFDMIFAEPDAYSAKAIASLYPDLPSRIAGSSLPDGDEAFASVLGTAPVLLPRLGVPADGVAPSEVMLDPVIEGRPPTRVARYPELLASIPPLDDVALTHAVINGEADADAIVRRVPLTVMAGNHPIPGMSVELARIALGADKLIWRNQKLKLGGRSLPADQKASLPLRFGNFPARAVHSAAHVMTGQVPPDAFRGKVVLIGLGGEGTADIVATPLSTNQFGVLVQAQAVDAILDNGWLARPPWLAGLEWLAGGGLVALVVLAASIRRRWLVLAVGLGLMAALPLVSWLAFARANLLFDPLRPLVIGLGAAAALAVALFVQTRAERSRLAAELVERRVISAEQEGELKAARRIQLGMVPGPERLAHIDPRVEIGAVLRPARSVGGDFYDAVMVGDDTLLFVMGDVAGKGVPAALYMALSKALAKAMLRRGADALGKAVSTLNLDLMDEADDEMGVTLLAGVLDCSTGHLALVNAGHENPLVLRSDGSIETLPLRGGPPLCVLEFPYAEESACLAPGETLVLITDGATEASNTENLLFGVHGVIDALRLQGAMAATARASDLAERVRAFEAGTVPSDDLTIMTLRRV